MRLTLLIKKELLLVVCFFAIAVACNQPQNEKGTETAYVENTAAVCYRHVQGRDTIHLSIRSHSGKVTGRMAFRFYEKDKSRGTINGVMKGDTLFADYHFMSEGMESFRELAFLRKGEVFVLGVGEILNSGNRDVFKDRKQIKFSDGVTLKKVACNHWSVMW